MKRSLWLAGLLWALTASAEQSKPQFPSRELSADMILRRPGAKEQQGKVYIGKQKLRTELSLPDRGQMAFIYDFEAGKALMVNSSRKVAVDVSAQMGTAMKQAGGGEAKGMEFLAWKEGNPCSQPKEGRTCKKLGAETVNGRQTEKWRVTEKDGKASLLWIDRVLSMPVKTETPAGGMELQNIKEGPQPAELFQVPKDFKVMTNPGMPGGMGMPGGQPPAEGAGQPEGQSPSGAAPTPKAEPPASPPSGK